MLNEFRTTASRARLALALTCLGLIGITWAVTIERIGFEHAATVANTMRSNANLALAFEEQTVRTLKGVDQILLFIMNEYAEYGRKLNIRGMIANGTLDAELFRFVGIVDARGDVILGSQDFNPVNLAAGEDFKFHQRDDDTKMFIGKSILGGITHKQVIPISRRINKADGSFGGMVIASVDPGYFTSFYLKADLGEQGVVTLVGLDGLMRARKAGQSVTTGGDFRNATLFTELAKSSIGSFLSLGRISGLPHFISYRTVRGYPLVVAVGTSQDEALASFRERTRRYYATAGFASILIVLFVAFMTAAWSRQQRAFDSLVESEARFRATFEQTAVGVAHTTLDGRLIKANAKVSEILGYTNAELSTMTLGDVVLPEDIDRTQSDRARLFRGEIHEVVAEARFVRKDQSVGWVAYGSSLVRDPSGEPKYFITQILDITERKRAEEALRESERRHREVVDNVDEVIYVIDVDPQEPFRGVVRFVSDRATHIVGCRPEEFLADQGLWISLVHPDDVPVLQERTAALHTSCEPGLREYRVRHRATGEYRWVEDLIRPHRNADGKIVSVFGVARDITERKRAEEALKQSLHRVQALSERVMKIQQEERDGIARELHDELGQSLTALKVNLQMLEPYHTGGEAEGYLAEALMIVGRSLEQIRGMMLDLRPPALAELGLATALKSHLARQADTAGWESHFEDATPPGRLRPELEMACFRVAQEALTNVMRHASAKRVWVVLGQNGGEVDLSVRDDGRGFDVAAASDNSSASAFGLISMHERARQIGGRLSICSAPGYGTEVRASFPRGPAGTQEPDAQAQA